MITVKDCFTVWPHFGTIDRLYGEGVFANAVQAIFKNNNVNGKLENLQLKELNNTLAATLKEDLMSCFEASNPIPSVIMDQICNSLRQASKDYEQWKWDEYSQLQDSDNAFYHSIEPFRNLWREIIEERRADVLVLDFIISTFARSFANVFSYSFKQTLDTFLLYRKDIDSLYCDIDLENEGMFFVVKLTIR